MTEAFDAAGVRLTVLTTVATIVDEATRRPARSIRAAADDIRAWLADPAGWSARSGMTDGATAMARLAARIEAVDSMLCIGLDSASSDCPERFRRAPRPQLDFNRAIIDQTADLVAAYKPNLAFYEARGADGWDELAETLDVLRDHAPDVFTIADAKRGDIAQHERGLCRRALRRARVSTR